MTDEVKRLQERYDFLFDAYVQGLCEGSELEAAGSALRAAIAKAKDGAPRPSTAPTAATTASGPRRRAPKCCLSLGC